MDQDVKNFIQNADANAKLYWSSLIDDVMPFWIKNSPDKEHGGYFTCLERDGKVFDTDKFIWLQGREAWMFAKLYNVLQGKLEDTKLKEYLALSKIGVEFLINHGMDSNGFFFFSTTRDGKPLESAWSIFSDAFASMAFAQYYKATKEERVKDLAIRTFNNFDKRKTNPRGQWSKGVGNTRPLTNLAVYMIDINLCLEFKESIPELDVTARQLNNIDVIFNKFLDPRGFLRENVGGNGLDDPINDNFDGRVVNPGHSIEAFWFLMESLSQMPNSDQQLINKCCDCIIKVLEYGWDKEHGGILYFLDRLGKPPQQLEWDQKLWWVHLETLVALSLGFKLTKRSDLAVWYNKVHEWSWPRFHDKQYGEWFGYLNRRGEISIDLKGGKWKGCFHVPRAMLLCYQNFEEISHLK